MRKGGEEIVKQWRLTLNLVGWGLLDGALAPALRISQPYSALLGPGNNNGKDRAMSAASRLKRAVSALMGNDVRTGSRGEFVPSGHFYSPLPDIDAIKESFKPDDGLTGIDLGIDAQCRFVDVIASFYPELPFSDHPGVGEPGTRFGYINDFFGHSDAITLFTMLRALRPRQVIEVGSGHSSAVMLDTRTRFFPETALCFIEPYPDRLKSLLRSGDDFELIEDKAQNVSIDRFAALQEGDILFIDSSHVSKAGSDVNDLFFPRTASPCRMCCRPHSRHPVAV